VHKEKLTQLDAEAGGPTMSQEESNPWTKAVEFDERIRRGGGGRGSRKSIHVKRKVIRESPWSNG